MICLVQISHETGLILIICQIKCVIFDQLRQRRRLAVLVERVFLAVFDFGVPVHLLIPALFNNFSPGDIANFIIFFAIVLFLILAIFLVE